jgi:hypothetical protein
MRWRRKRRHLAHRPAVFDHLLGRLGLELIRVPLAAHAHLLRCRNVRLGDVYWSRGDSVDAEVLFSMAVRSP